MNLTSSSLWLLALIGIALLGFAMTARRYVAHLTHEKSSSPTLDDVGDLLVRWRGQQEPDRHVLATALAAPSWLDPATGGPRA